MEHPVNGHNPHENTKTEEAKNSAAPVPISAATSPSPVPPTHISANSPQPITSTAGTVSSNYESNPFKVSITGLLTILKTNPMPAILIGLVLILAMVGLGIIFAILSKAMPVVSTVIMLGGLVLVLPVIVGAYSSLAVSSMKGETKKTGEMYNDAFKKIVPIIAAFILIGFVVTIGLILLIIPGIIFAAWFSLTFIAMFDENLGAIDSMKRSKELVSGHVIEMIGAMFAGSVLSGGTSSSGGGLLSPAISLAPMIGRYEQLKDLKARGVTKPKVHWLNYLVFIVIAAVIVLIGLITASIFNSINNLSNKKSDPYYQLNDYNYPRPQYDAPTNRSRYDYNSQDYNTQ